ncbi:hypothetical protein D3C77_727670 [compost metagenome]
MSDPVGLCASDCVKNKRGFSRCNKASSATTSGPSDRRGTPSMRTPASFSLPNSG